MTPHISILESSMVRDIGACVPFSFYTLQNFMVVKLVQVS